VDEMIATPNALDAPDAPALALPLPPPRTARLAVMVIFFMNGASLGGWFPRIPQVQRELGLSDGALGVALLGTAVGALLGQPTTAWLIARWGSRRITFLAALALCIALPLPSLAPALPSLLLALAALGAANGILDVAMNVQAVAIERRYHRPIMTTFHGLFSAGGLIGAAIAGVVARQGIGPTPHLLAVAAVLAVVVLLVRPWLLPSDVEVGAAGPAFARPSRALAGLGIVAFCVLLAEGAMADWSAVYLRNTLGATAAFAAIGYAAFSFAMAAGRLTGDWLTARLGPVAIVRLGGVLVALGLGAGLLAGRPLASLLGFAAVGAGLSCAFPVVLSAAGRTPNLSPGAAIAAVATAGYTGFLVGPPLIGFVAQLIGLRLGLGVVVLLGLAMVVLARAVRNVPPAPTPEA